MLVHGMNMRPADFEYRGWLVKIEIDHVDNYFSGHADLHHEGKSKCRLVLATTGLDINSARWALDSKARDFIDEWPMGLCGLELEQLVFKSCSATRESKDASDI